jgi:hypothetical protein
MIDGGWGGIRTHETLSRLPVFKTGAFNRSATHPSPNSPGWDDRNSAGFVYHPHRTGVHTIRAPSSGNAYGNTASAGVPPALISGHPDFNPAFILYP